MSDYKKRLDNLLRHINNVRDATELLGKRLIERGNKELGRTLIANGLIHDYSKFFGIEWDLLSDYDKSKDDPGLQLAIQQHVTTNPHHPEYWHDIKNMPDVYLAEMVCDLSARSSEFGNDLREWIKERATKKFGFTCQDKVYKKIKDFVDLLLDKGL